MKEIGMKRLVRRNRLVWMTMPLSVGLLAGMVSCKQEVNTQAAKDGGESVSTQNMPIPKDTTKWSAYAIEQVDLLRKERFEVNRVSLLLLMATKPSLFPGSLAWIEKLMVESKAEFGIGNVIRAYIQIAEAEGKSESIAPNLMACLQRSAPSEIDYQDFVYGVATGWIEAGMPEKAISFVATWPQGHEKRAAFLEIASYLAGEGQAVLARQVLAKAADIPIAWTGSEGPDYLVVQAALLDDSIEKKIESDTSPHGASGLWCTAARGYMQAKRRDLAQAALKRAREMDTKSETGFELVNSLTSIAKEQADFKFWDDLADTLKLLRPDASKLPVELESQLLSLYAVAGDSASIWRVLDALPVTKRGEALSRLLQGTTRYKPFSADIYDGCLARLEGLEKTNIPASTGYRNVRQARESLVRAYATAGKLDKARAILEPLLQEMSESRDLVEAAYLFIDAGDSVTAEKMARHMSGFNKPLLAGRLEYESVKSLPFNLASDVINKKVNDPAVRASVAILFVRQAFPARQR